jgi:hypothetical protein
LYSLKLPSFLRLTILNVLSQNGGEREQGGTENVSVMVAKGRLYCDQTHGLFKPQSVLNMEIPEWEKCIPTFFVCSAAMVGPE